MTHRTPSRSGPRQRAARVTGLAILLGCLSTTAAAQSLEEPPIWMATWNEPFSLTVGVDVDSLGNVYVADLYNYGIVKVDSNGNYLKRWYSGYYPNGVSIDRTTDQLYVPKSATYCVRVFDTDGGLIREWGQHTYRPVSPNQFKDPMDAAIDAEGNVYVTDYNTYYYMGTCGRVQKFDATGTFITWWGSRGSGDGQFEHPYGIEYSLITGKVYVADTGNHRIQVFDTAGHFLFKWGSWGHGPGQFVGPRGTAMDDEGNLYVADTDNHRIQKFDGYGNFLTEWGTGGSADGQFNRPHDVAVDALGNIYVADTYNRRIQKFGYDRDRDGIADGADNCPNDPNPGQEDMDGDGAGDVCDADRDGDGVSNDTDNCPDTPNPDQKDMDGDGRGDVCDNDIDGDGISNEDDACPYEDPNGLDANDDGCIDRIDELPDLIRSLGLAPDREASLLDSVYAAMASLQRGQTETAINQLEALINKVEAQTGNGINEEDSYILIQFVRNVIENMG